MSYETLKVWLTQDIQVDLERSENDIRVGALMTLDKLCDALGVPAHPDLEHAISRINAALDDARS